MLRLWHLTCLLYLIETETLNLLFFYACQSFNEIASLIIIFKVDWHTFTLFDSFNHVSILIYHLVLQSHLIAHEFSLKFVLDVHFVLKLLSLRKDIHRMQFLVLRENLRMLLLILVVCIGTSRFFLSAFLVQVFFNIWSGGLIPYLVLVISSRMSPQIEPLIIIRILNRGYWLCLAPYKLLLLVIFGEETSLLLSVPRFWKLVYHVFNLVERGFLRIFC